MMLPHPEKAFDSLKSYISLEMNQNKVEMLRAGEPEIPPTPVICTTSQMAKWIIPPLMVFSHRFR